MEYKCAYPSINGAVFPNTLGWVFWSASSYAGGTYYAWGVEFSFGSSAHFYKNENDGNYVRPVRGGQ